MVRPMVHSTKHIVQFSIRTIESGTVENLTIVDSVAVANKNIPAEVEEGSTIKACYLEIWVRAGSATASSGQHVLYKKSAGQGFPSTTNMGQLHDWNNKKNIFATQMGLFNDQDANATRIYGGWYKIPKGKQRFGLGDQLIITGFATAIDLQICGFAVYKEYT